MASEPTDVRIEIVGVAAGQGFNPFHQPAIVTGLEGKPFDDLMGALKAFVDANPGLKSANITIEPGKK